MDCTITMIHISVDLLMIHIETPIPPPLGPNATPTDLRRELYWGKKKKEKLVDENEVLRNQMFNASQQIAQSTGTVHETRSAAFNKNAADFRRIMNAASARIKEWDDHIEAINQRLKLEDPDATLSTTNNSEQPRRSFRTQIQLRKFNGDIESWFNFWETFRTLIHEDPSMPFVEKFNALESVLEGDAKTLIEGLKMDETGYETAIELLIKNYGDDQKQIRDLNKELMNLPNSNDYEDDEKLYLRIEKICRQLTALNQNIGQAPYYMMIEGKLSAEVLDKYFTIKDAEDENNWNTDKFRKAFGRAINQIKGRHEARNIARRSKPTTRTQEPTMNFLGRVNTSPNYRSPDRRWNQRQNTVRTENRPFQGQRRNEEQSQSPKQERSKFRNGSPYKARSSSSSSEHSSKSPIRYPCELCEQLHPPIHCTKYRTANERRDRAMKKELCFRCLKRGHYANKCMKPKVLCPICNRSNHNQALCRHQKRFIRKALQGKNKKHLQLKKRKQLILLVFK
uniref:CCHC-type domain-containing protein n=1 Tax=Meloidogyne incognita TaxID=6306 RepID=A0A914M4G7_MELIC